MSHACYGCGCDEAEVREALTQLLVAAQHQRDASPGAQPQLLQAITIAEGVLSKSTPFFDEPDFNLGDEGDGFNGYNA